jgi:hypothetical protein
METSKNHKFIFINHRGYRENSPQIVFKYSPQISQMDADCLLRIRNNKIDKQF